MEKKYSTYSSPPSARLDDTVRNTRGIPVMTLCPECGCNTISRITSDYSTEDGAIIKGLEYWHCATCHANFFDPAAAKRIVNEN